MENDLNETEATLSETLPPDQPSEVKAELEVKELERALDNRQRRLADLERIYHSAVRDRELATALAGRPLVPNAAEQLIKLWRDDFEVVNEGGALEVLASDGRKLAAAVAERLDRPEYAHFVLPSSRGGTRGGSVVNTPTPPTAPTPRNLGEAVIQKWRNDSSLRKPEQGSTIGLGRPRR